MSALYSQQMLPQGCFVAAFSSSFLILGSAKAATIRVRAISSSVIPSYWDSDTSIHSTNARICINRESQLAEEILSWFGVPGRDLPIETSDLSSIRVPKSPTASKSLPTILVEIFSSERNKLCGRNTHPRLNQEFAKLGPLKCNLNILIRRLLARTAV